MKASSAHSNYFSGLFHQRQGFILVLTCIFLLIFVGSLFAGNPPLTHFPGKPAPTGFHAIPGKPSANTLSHAAFKPDLVVEGIRFEKKAAGKAEATIIIKNGGTAPSHATRVSAVLTRGDGSHAKNSWSVQALKAGTTKVLTWRISVKPGHNNLKVSISDTNKNGNRLEKEYFLMAKVVQVLSHPREQITEGARRASKAQASKARGRLVVQEISFDDLRARKPGETWVAINLKNIGKKATAAREFRVQVRRADGTRAWKRFRVRALRPGETTRIESFVKMSHGENTLKVMGIGGMNRHGLTTFEGPPREFIARHVFSPRAFRMVHKNNAELAKNAARVSKGKEKTVTPNVNTLKALSTAKHITPPKHKKISTYDDRFHPDLKIISMEITPQPPVIGKKIHCIIHVVNVGDDYVQLVNLKIVAQLSVRGPLGEEPMMKQTSTGHLRPVNSPGGGDIRFDFSYSVPSEGKYWNFVRVKFSSYVGEKNFENNVGEKFYIISPLPDLRVWISHPGNVRVSGPKRWFRFFVKNTGGAASKETTMRLHIDEDGTHTYTIPPLAPGESSAEHKRGIRWWHKGVKRYQIVVNPDRTFDESDWTNNSMRGSLYVHNPKVVFDPTATVYRPLDIYLKKHAPFVTGKTVSVVFKIFNPSDRDLSDKTKFIIDIHHPSPSTKTEHFEFTYDRFMPGEAVYKKLTIKFDYAGKAHYTIQRFLVLRNGYKLEPIPLDSDHAHGAFEVFPRLGVPVGPPVLGSPPKGN